MITNVGPVHLEKVGDLDGVVRAKSELIDALPPGGTAVVPADFPVERDDLEVVRVGEDVTLEAFEPARGAASHLARHGRGRLHRPPPRRERAHRARRRDALGLADRRASASTSSSPSGGTRSCRSRAAACWSTTPGTRTRSRCARRSSTSSSSPPAAGRSPCSATWPSSATYTDGGPPRGRRARRASSGSTWWSRSGRRPRRTAAAASRTADEALALLRGAPRARRLRARQGRARAMGLERVADGSPDDACTRASGPTSCIAGDRRDGDLDRRRAALHRRSCACKRVRAARSARRGPRARREAGDADDGRAADPRSRRPSRS